MNQSAHLISFFASSRGTVLSTTALAFAFLLSNMPLAAQETTTPEPIEPIEPVEEVTAAELEATMTEVEVSEEDPGAFDFPDLSDMTDLPDFGSFPPLPEIDPQFEQQIAAFRSAAAERRDRIAYVQARTDLEASAEFQNLRAAIDSAPTDEERRQLRINYYEALYANLSRQLPSQKALLDGELNRKMNQLSFRQIRSHEESEAYEASIR
ncbi:MAG: hypothetical protein ACFCU3_06225 [Verrucomicrobiales bacterium]